LVPDFKGPSAGDLLGWSYVVHDSDDDSPGFIKQFCYAVDNDNLGDVPGGYDFGGWGTLELMAPPPPPVVEEPEAAADLPAAPEAAPAAVTAAPAPAAPQTNDAGMIFVVLLAISSAGIAVCKKRLSMR